MSHEKGIHVIVVGCGAIGSFLVSLLARMPGVTRITLIDPDTYHHSNLRSQNIFPGDVGEPKVAVQVEGQEIPTGLLTTEPVPDIVCVNV